MSLEFGSHLGQIRLAALLRHFQRGDFATFRRACELAFGREASSSRYFHANLLFAAQVGGLCEVGTERGLTKWWWAAHQGDVDIRSLRPKQIGLSAEWFERHQGSLVPLVTDSERSVLLLGARASSDESNPGTGVFATRLDQLAPAFRDVEAQICVPVPFLDDFPGRVEAYCPDRGSWDSAAVDMRKGAQLLRAQREYSGVSLYVQHAALGIRVKISQPEWAFIAAYFLLPWPLSSLIQIEGTTVSVRRTVRLPILMSRLLFAGAKALRMGPRVVFEGVDHRSIAGVLGYLKRAGERG